jgi:hypothetical protein
VTLTLNLITRGRPDRLLDTVKQTAPMLARADTVYMISVDDDDRPTLGVVDRLKAIDRRVMVNIKPREDAIGDKWSRVLEVPASLYLIQGDYRPYVTPGFDQIFLDAGALFPDGIGGVYSRMDNFSFPAVFALTHRLVQKLGYFMPSVFPYWFVDHWIDDILRMIGRIAFADVSLSGLMQKPETQERRDIALWTTFFDCQRLVRRETARRLIDDPDFMEPEWRKQLLRAAFPLQEYRSQWINDTVRAAFAAARPTADDGGPRYARMKQKALAMITELKSELLKEIDT